MIKFKDLKFKKHFSCINRKDKKRILKSNPSLRKSVIFKKHKRCLLKLNNGIKISIIFGELFFSNGIDTYEAMILNFNNKPLGYLTKEELMEFVNRIDKYENLLQLSKEIDEENKSL